MAKTTLSVVLQCVRGLTHSATSQISYMSESIEDVMLCLLHVLCPQAGSYVQRRHFSLFSASLFSPLYPSSASSIVLGLPRIFFPSILPSMKSLSRVSLLKMCPIHFFCRPRIVPISDLFSSTSCKISSFVLRSTQLIFSILRQIHISKASSRFMSSCLIVHVSEPYRTTLHTNAFTILFFSFLFRPPLRSSPTKSRLLKWFLYWEKNRIILFFVHILT